VNYGIPTSAAQLAGITGLQACIIRPKAKVAIQYAFYLIRLYSVMDFTQELLLKF
jgi:hypothetical protein